MSANVEELFYLDTEINGERFTPWHGLGTPVSEAPTSQDAIRLAGLDWNVLQKETYINVDGKQIPTGAIANYRDTDNTVLGVVRKTYKVVQNREAFEFTDALLDMDVKYVTAGSLANGKHIWLLAQMPDTSVLGDKMENYLVFANTHDGTGAVKVAQTPVRIVCENTLNMALKGAKRFFSIYHKGNIMSKMEEARYVLSNAAAYQAEFNNEAERLAAIKLDKLGVTRFMAQMFPMTEEDNDRKVANIERMRDMVMFAYNRDDLGNLRGTAYGMLNAVSDVAFHADPLRKTSTYRENRMFGAIRGNNMFDKAYEILAA